MREAKKLLKVYCKNVSWNWDLVSPPCLRNVGEWHKRAKNPSPGTNGLPYAAWAFAGPTAERTIWRVTQNIFDKNRPNVHFNDGLWMFPPKKSLPTDSSSSAAVSRDALATRPIAMKNSENKTMCAIVAQTTTQMCKVSTSEFQRGFVPGRQIIQNNVDLDTDSRIHAMECMDRRNVFDMEQNVTDANASELAALALYDFATAFPTIFHKWIRSALYRCPRGFS